MLRLTLRKKKDRGKVLKALKQRKTKVRSNPSVKFTDGASRYLEGQRGLRCGRARLGADEF